MNRARVVFVTFVVLVVAAVAGLAAYLGPNGLAFVLHDERETAPFVMVNLLDFDDTAAEIRYRQGFADPALGLTQAIGGESLWEGRLESLVEGRLHDEWQLVSLVRYPSRAAFVDLVTSAEYRALLAGRDASLDRSAALAATPTTPFEGAGSAFALRLVRGSADDWRERYDTEWQAEDTALLERHGGRVAWRAGISPLDAAPEFAFDEVWLYAFVDVAGRSAWADDIERRTVQSLERRLFARDVVLSLRASGPAAREAPVDSESEAEEVDGAELVELAEVGERARLQVGEVLEAVDL
jgi:uncharacterized protein (DUF1330 family)